MTAEERMAYFQGEKRRIPVYPVSEIRKNSYEKFFFKIKFFAAVILFIVFLSMDYTEFRIYGIGSKEIITEVTKDSEFIKALDL